MNELKAFLGRVIYRVKAFVRRNPVRVRAYVAAALAAVASAVPPLAGLEGHALAIGAVTALVMVWAGHAGAARVELSETPANGEGSPER